MNDILEQKFGSDIRGYNHIKASDIERTSETQLNELHKNFEEMSYEDFCRYINNNKYMIDINNILKYCKKNNIPIHDESHGIELTIFKRNKK